MWFCQPERILAIAFLGMCKRAGVCVCVLDVSAHSDSPWGKQQLRDCLEKGVQSLGACGCPRAGQELGQNQLKSLDTAQCLVGQLK